TSRGEAIRAAAVSALAAAGADEPVFAAATDKAWQVRAAVANALPRWPNPRGVKLARALLDDQSMEVQRSVLVATDAWPLAQAGPVLLAALGKAPVMTRRIAIEKLAARWPEAQAFPEQGTPENRAAALADLTARFHRQFGDVEQASGEGQAAPGDKPRPVAPEQLARAEAVLANLADPRLASADRRRALDSLAAMGPELVEALSILAVDRNQVLPEDVYTDVLPKQDPVFAALDRLRSADVIARRRAASELAERAGDHPPGRLALARLARLVAEEPDALVWRSVLAAVASDGSEPAIRLAYAAIGNPAPEVRRRACENLAARPSPRHVKVLLPALADPSQPVAGAAIAALVAGGQLDDTRPLRQLLATPNEPLRVEAAAALARFGDPSGVDALGQLAYSRDVAVRQQVAQAMGDLADPRFTPVLIRMLDDHLTVRRVALAALTKVTGHDAPHSDNQQPPRSTAEQIALWKDWFQRQDNSVDGRR
ncbi:MAG: HEAT repeat domain-containing protein, partial [Planctomycetia bacterium]|nr:HEAT repeat domain-containing protein [Planctomycetia bacterium]